MLYQHLLMGPRPYFVGASQMNTFAEHRHPELELSFCVSGSYQICIDKKVYTLHPGDLAIVGPMVSHGIPENSTAICRGLTVMAGPMLLAEYYDFFTHAQWTFPVLHLASSPQDEPLHALLLETARLRANPDDFSDLAIKGNLYKIFGFLLSYCTAASGDKGSFKKLRNVQKIEQALELIHTRFAEPLTVDQVAALTGYGKSNFCKIFKEITGQTFHHVLNSHRLQNSLLLLENTFLSVEEIAQQVGLTDGKTFCRIFKLAYGVTPGAYRKQHQ